MRELGAMLVASNRKEAVKIYRARRAKWIVEAEAAVRCMGKNPAEVLRYFDFD